MRNKFIALTTEYGDWIVLKDPLGNAIYSGHDRLNELCRDLIDWFGYSVEFVTITQEEMEKYG